METAAPINPSWAGVALAVIALATQAAQVLGPVAKGWLAKTKPSPRASTESVSRKITSLSSSVEANRAAADARHDELTDSVTVIFGRIEKNLLDAAHERGELQAEIRLTRQAVEVLAARVAAELKDAR